MEKSKDIFISYRNDGVGSNFATRLTEDLKNQGYSVYFNPDEARSGNFPERLQHAVEACKDFICIVSLGYLEKLFSNDKVCWIRDELLCARKNHKNIIPLLINGTQMPSDSAKMPKELDFFPKIDAYTFPEQYIISPFYTLCTVLHSRNDGKNSYRDVYNSNPNFDSNLILSDVLAQAESGSAKAMYEAGVFYYYGLSSEPDERKAAYWFKKVSVSNSEFTPLANKFIARMYYAGSMPREPQSYEKSFEYHLKSADKDIYSAGQVGFMRSIGSGCTFDYDETERYFLSLLDSLDNPRKATLCRFYMEHGEFQKAAKIYESMADVFPEAAFQLGLMYKRGVLSNPFMPDYIKAAYYFQMAVDSGYIPAAYELGTLYFNPTGGFKKDFSKALKNYTIAANSGHVNAQYMLGYMYKYGHVKKDLALSVKYFELAAENGHLLSATHLGLLYQQEELHNYEKAFKYCKLASDAGDSTAEFVLGNMYLCGRGCEVDVDKAFLCFQHATEYGTPEASIMLNKMIQNNL